MPARDFLIAGAGAVHNSFLFLPGHIGAQDIRHI